MTKRDTNDGHFVWQQRIVYEEYANKIGYIGYALYCALTNYAFGKEVVWPSESTLAEKLGLAIPTVEKYLAILESKKLIKRKKKIGKVSKICLLKIKSRPLNKVKWPPKRDLGAPLNEIYPNNKNMNKKNK